MKKNLLLIITLLCAVAQGTWAQPGVKTEDELANAVKENGAVVQMAADITLTNTITLQENLKVTIKMNKHSLSHSKQLDSDYSCIFIVPASSELIIEGGTITDVDNRKPKNTEYVAGAIVNYGTLTLTGDTIKNCTGLLGGAIKNNQGATLNLNSCLFDKDEAVKNGDNTGNGGAIWNNGKLVLFDTKFQDCEAIGGAAIWNDASGNISMGTDNSNTAFYSNKASGDGGAIYNLGTLTMNGTTFNTNIATGQAGAIWNIGTATVKGCNFQLNQANEAGAIYVALKSKTFTLQGGSYTQNKATTSGGAIYCAATMNLDAVTFSDNKALNGDGGVCYITTDGNVTITDENGVGNNFNNNTSTGNGGAFFTGGKLSVLGVNAKGNSSNVGGFLYIDANGSAAVNTKTTLSENTATTLGGGIYDAGTLSMQGKISVKQNTGADSQKSNVYLPSGKVITVAGALDASGIGISLEDVEGTFTSGYKTNNSSTSPDKVFSADYLEEFYCVALSGNEAAVALQNPIVITEESALRRALDMFPNVNFQLANDLDLSNSTLSIPTDHTVGIDLNGKTLDRKLTKRGEGGGQVITVREGATLNLSNGTLKGGWGGNSGGIANESGTATLTDVNITGCTGDDSGGGICNLGGTLTMKGGSLTGNISNDHGNPSGGGAIFNAEGATLFLTGVSITGNQAKVKGGGGVNNWGTATIDGCTITGNTCKTNGGGVWSSSNSTLNMQGKNTITDNQGNGNVYLSEGAVITVKSNIEGSKIGVTLEDDLGVFTTGFKKNHPEGNVDPATIFTPDEDNFFDVALSGDEVAMIVQPLISVDNFDDLRRAVQFDGANIQLAANINSSDLLRIEDNRTMTIDLNGKTLNRGLTSLYNGHGQVVVVEEGATLNLSNGTLTGGFGGDGGGLENKGTANLTDVTITGNHADNRGGGISNQRTLTMTGGSITNNVTNDADAVAGGGAIYTYKGSNTTLTGVTITGNQAKVAGGGGVNNWGTVTIDGCTITGNTSKANGGGVWNGPDSKLNMQGKNTVTDNQGNGAVNNVYLRDGVVITVTGSLEGSQIGIRMSSPGTFTTGYYAQNKDVAPKNYFLSDDENYKIDLLDNEAELKSGKENETTSILSIEADGNGFDKAEGVWYDLSGRRVVNTQLKKGIYIVNGKKIMVK